MAVTGCTWCTANQESPAGRYSALDSSSLHINVKGQPFLQRKMLGNRKYPMANYPDQKYPNPLPGVPHCHITAVTSS